MSVNGVIIVVFLFVLLYVSIFSFWRVLCSVWMVVTRIVF